MNGFIKNKEFCIKNKECCTKNTRLQSLVGFITSIPVFADAAFIVLCPVIDNIIRQGGHPTAHFALALGLATSHTMVPPTPGPVFAAAALGADLGLVVAAGSVVAMSGCLAATLFCFMIPPPTPDPPTAQHPPPQPQERQQRRPGEQAAVYGPAEGADGRRRQPPKLW